jgi:ketosteroid isomerase-like protein
MEIDLKSVVEEVRAAFDDYAAALAAGDQERLDSIFWNDPRVVRLGASSNQFGIDAIRRFRAGRTANGQTVLCHSVRINAFGTDVAVVNALFRRGADIRRLGRWTQVWVRLPEGWRIASAHASDIPDMAPSAGAAKDAGAR